MIKRIMGFILVFAVILTLTVPSFAEPAGSITQPKATINNINNIEKLQAQLKKLQDELIGIESKIKQEIDKAKALRDKNAKKNPDYLSEVEKKIQDMLGKMTASEQREMQQLKDDITKWTENIAKFRAALQERKTNIDKNLNTDIVNLDKRIAAAKNADEKAKLEALKVIKQNYATDQKAAIDKYLADMDAFWKDKQKLWDERLALLARRQAIESEFHNTMTDLRLNEVKDYTVTMPPQKVRSDEQIEKEIRDRYQKRIAALNNQILNLQKRIDALMAKAT